MDPPPRTKETLTFKTVGDLKLDANGGAMATIRIPAGLPPSLAGTTVYHAFLSLGANGAYASNAVPLQIIP